MGPHFQIFRINSLLERQCVSFGRTNRTLKLAKSKKRLRTGSKMYWNVEDVNIGGNRKLRFQKWRGHGFPSAKPANKVQDKNGSGTGGPVVKIVERIDNLAHGKMLADDVGLQNSVQRGNVDFLEGKNLMLWLEDSSHFVYYSRTPIKNIAYPINNPGVILYKVIRVKYERNKPGHHSIGRRVTSMRQIARDRAEYNSQRRGWVWRSAKD